MRVQKELDEVNKFRKQMGMPPIVVTKKKCLKCNIKFDSEGPKNRMCDYCSHSDGEVRVFH